MLEWILNLELSSDSQNLNLIASIPDNMSFIINFSVKYSERIRKLQKLKRMETLLASQLTIILFLTLRKHKI